MPGSARTSRRRASPRRSGEPARVRPTLLLVAVVFQLLLVGACVEGADAVADSPLRRDTPVKGHQFAGIPTESGAIDLTEWALVSSIAKGEPPRIVPVGAALPEVTSWSAIGSNGDGDGALNGTVFAMAISGSDLYVGGSFRNAAGIAAADYVARWDGTRWSALGGDAAGRGAINSDVDALAIVGDDVYVGGRFTDAAGIAEADLIARWDGTRWSALGSNGAGNGALNNTVFRIVSSGDDLYVTGGFTDVAGIANADFLARWSGGEWSALASGDSTDGPLNDGVRSLVSVGDEIYIGGDFTNVAGIPAADYVARWDGERWWALGSNGTGDGALNAPAGPLVVTASDIYAGGAFTNAGGATDADHLARFDGSEWTAVGPDGSGDGALNSRVTALQRRGTELYVAGSFTDVAGIPQADYVARWDGTAWSALAAPSGPDGPINSDVCCSLLIAGDQLFISGRFTDAAGIAEADYVVAFELGGEVVALRDSVPTPAEVTLDPIIVAQTVALAAAVVVFIPFPSALFDSTFEANYAEIMGWIHSAKRRFRRLRDRLATWGLGVLARLRGRAPAEATDIAQPSAPVADRLAPGDDVPGRDGWTTRWRIAGALLLGALLCCFLDPTFGLGLTSLATFAGMTVGLAVTMLAFDLPRAVAYLRTKEPDSPPASTDALDDTSTAEGTRARPYVRALPAGLAIAAGCVALSRVTDFQPGYLYGVVIGVAAQRKLSEAAASRVAAAATVLMLAAGYAAWLGLGQVGGTEGEGPDALAAIAVRTTLVTIVVAGLQGAMLSLLPMRRMPGGKIRMWNPRVWGVLAFVALVGFWHILVNPSTGYLADSSRTPLLTIVALLALFGLGSVSFWGAFELRRRRRIQPAPT
jgi:hypothetical protein